MQFLPRKKGWIAPRRKCASLRACCASRPGLGLLLAVLLGACDSGEPGRLGAREIEGPEGEALVRHLIARLPVLDPEVPKEYCVIFGRASTSMKFTERMKDLKVHFVSGDVLTVRDPDKMIIDPSNGSAAGDAADLGDQAHGRAHAATRWQAGLTRRPSRGAITSCRTTARAGWSRRASASRETTNRRNSRAGRVTRSSRPWVLRSSRPATHVTCRGRDASDTHRPEARVTCIQSREVLTQFRQSAGAASV